MPQIFDGKPPPLLQEATWRKSRHSNPNGNCVELAELGEEIAVRNSRHSGGPVQIYSRAQIAVFVQGVKKGGFDQGTGDARPSAPEGLPGFRTGVLPSMVGRSVVLHP